jgi:hypothetical protein
MTFVRSSLNPWGDNASADEGHLYLTSLCCLVLNLKHLRTSPQHLALHTKPPGCPHCNPCSGEDEVVAEDFLEFQEYDEF